MKEMKIETEQVSMSGWRRFIAPITGVVIVILVGALTYYLAMAH